MDPRSIDDDPDAANLRAWRDGDLAAGKRLFESLFDELFAFFRNKCGDPEDLVQATLLACMEGVDRFEGRSSFRVFVWSIAKNRLYSHWRVQYAPRQEVDISSISVAAIDPTPSRALANKQDHQQLASALRTIALEDQLLLECYYWQRLTAPELGEILGLAEPAVRSRLRRALGRLREQVERWGAQVDVSTTLASIDRWSEQLQALSPGSG